jgi:hypothetical protein
MLLVDDTPRKAKLRRLLTAARKSLNRRRMQLKRSQSKTQKGNKETIYKAACKEIKSVTFKILLRMQMLHKRGSGWSEEEKQLAMELIYRSPTLYDNLRNDKDFNLPSRKTISRWLNVMDLKPGVSENLLEILKEK